MNKKMTVSINKDSINVTKDSKKETIVDNTSNDSKDHDTKLNNSEEYIDILTLMDDVISIFENFVNMEEDIRSNISRQDLSEQDILHKIELDKFDACKGYKLAYMIKDIRNKRRIYKNKKRIAGQMIEFSEKYIKLLKNFKDNMQKAYNNIGKDNYKVKELKDEFGNIIKQNKK